MPFKVRERRTSEHTYYVRAEQHALAREMVRGGGVSPSKVTYEDAERAKLSSEHISDQQYMEGVAKGVSVDPVEEAIRCVVVDYMSREQPVIKTGDLVSAITAAVRGIRL